MTGNRWAAKGYTGNCKEMSDSAGPSITDAMKNYLAFATATSMVDDANAQVPAASALELQGMARAVLAAINKVPLPEGFELPPGQPKATKAFGRELLASSPSFYDEVRRNLAVGQANPFPWSHGGFSFV